MKISILFLIIKGPMVSTYFYTLLHEFSNKCMPSWQVRSISFEKVSFHCHLPVGNRLLLPIKPQWFLFSLAATVNLQKGKNVQFLGTIYVGLGVTTELERTATGTAQRKLGNRNPLPIPLPQLWMPLSSNLYWTLKKCLKTENCSRSWYSQCFFFFFLHFSFVLWCLRCKFTQKNVRNQFYSKCQKNSTLSYFLTIEPQNIT